MLHISQNIRLVRLLKEKTQVEFGELLKVSTAMIKSYESGKAKPDELFLSRLSRLTGVLESDLMNRQLKEEDLGKKAEKVENGDQKKEEPEIDFNQPIVQIVLNLSYQGKKNADSMDKMAATNERNTEIIAALVSKLIPNSKLAEKLTASLANSHEDEDAPAESFLNEEGIQKLKDQLHNGKRKTVNK